MMSILLWALHDFLHGRQAVVGWFILLQAVQVPYSLAIMGLLAPLLPTAGSLDSLTSALVCGITLCSLLFHRQFLALFQPLQLLLRGLDLLIVATLMALLLLLAGQARSALQLNALAGLLAAPLFLGLALTARIDALPGRRLLHMFYAIMTLSLLITFAPLLGLAKATAWNLHSTLIHGLIAAALMAVLLYLRSRQLQRQGRQALIELTLAQQQLQIERTQLAEQHRFMAMLTHEIKTPLATVRLTLDTLSIAGPRLQRMDRALQDMDRIIDRCRQTDQLEQDGLSQQVQSCRLDAVLQETAAASSAPGRIQLTLAPALPPLTTDPHLLAIALGNLFDNALKYAAPDTPVNVSAECVIAHGRPGLRITVANLPGPVGLPEADKVFVKYYRSPAAHARSGSGLGLYLVKGIANKLGGTITYEGTAGQVCFSLWLLQ